MTVVDSFVEWAHAGLLQSEEACEYMLGRGVSPEQWARHKLGFVLGDFHPNSSVDPGHSDACGDKDQRHRWCDSCRLARWSSVWDGDEWPKKQLVGRKIVGSVVMPLTSYSGAFVGFQTRSIRGKEFDSFSLSRRPEGYFFGVAPNMDAIWAKKQVIATEGPFDQLVLERLIAPNVVGMTTNTSNMHQTLFFKRFVDDLILVTDMDKAGRDGAEAIRVKVADRPAVRNVRFEVKNRKGEKCKDANEVWKALGDERFARYFSDLIERTI